MSQEWVAATWWAIPFLIICAGTLWFLLWCGRRRVEAGEVADILAGQSRREIHAHTTLEPLSRFEFERYFLFLRLFLLFTPVFILLAYGHPAVSSEIIDTVAISVDCSAAWLLLRFRPDTLLRYQLLLRGGDIALGYLV